MWMFQFRLIHIKQKLPKQAIEAGAHIINDIWGAKADEEMAAVAAEYDVPIILMHNRNDRNYQRFIRDVLNDLYESIAIVKKAGVRDENIILTQVSVLQEIIKRISNDAELRYTCSLGYPVLIRNIKKIDDWTST